MQVDALIKDYTTVFTVVAVVATWLIARHLFRKKKPWKSIPGWLPMVGHYHHVGGTEWMTEVQEKWAALYGGETGCFEIDLMGVRYVVVCSEERAMEVLKQRPYKVQRNDNLKEAANSAKAQGVFMAEGSQWQAEKKLVAAVLNRANVHDFVPAFKQVASSLINKWKCDSLDSGLVTISADIGHMTADAISLSILNTNFDFINSPESQMATDVFRGFQGFQLRALSPIWYWRIPFVGQDLDGYGKHFRNISATLNQAVDEFEKKREQEQKSAEKNSTFLGKLYDVMEKENSRLTRTRVVGNMVTVFVAAIDTTAGALNTAMYLLACNKELQQELREHVKDIDLSKASLDDLYTKAPLIKSFLHEVHRLYGVTFFMFKTAAEIPFCGCTLPPQQNVMLLNRYISTQTEKPASDVPRGPDNVAPSEFSHRRYLVPKAEDKEIKDDQDAQKWECVSPSLKGASFMNFGHGARICPGRIYSEALSYCLFISVLQTYEFELAPNHPPVKIVFDTMMGPDCEVQLKVTKLATK